MRIIGIDPGYGILGWSVIDSGLKLAAYGTIQTPPGEPIDFRLLQIYSELLDIIKKYSPEHAAIEKLFFSRNTTTALDVSKTIGVVLLAFRQSGIDYSEYAPVQVKKAITGFGRAGKVQMQTMIARIFGLKEIPKPDDAADALAIAACHAFYSGRPGIR